MTTKQLSAYNNDPSFKEAFMSELRKHEAADAVRQGFYGREDDNAVGFRGCSVGCALHSLNTIRGEHAYYGDHEHLAEWLDIPVEIVYINDAIFEGLPVEDAKRFPLQFAEAIQLGYDYEQLKTFPKFAHTILTDPETGILTLTENRDAREIARQMISLYKRWIAGDKAPLEEWDRVYDHALSALRALRDLRALSDLRALRALSALSALSDLSALRDLSDLRALRALRALSDLSDRRFQFFRDTLLKILREAPIAETA